MPSQNSRGNSVTYLVVGLVVVGAIVAVVCMCTNNNASSAAAPIVNMLSSGARDQDTGTNQSADKADIVPYVERDSSKIYGASNVVSVPSSGNPLNDCAFKNLSVQDKNDPIQDVAKSFPSSAKGKKFMDETGASMPVAADHVAQMRSSYMNCYQPDRGAIATRGGIDGSNDDGGLRGNLELKQRVAKQVQAFIKKNPDALSLLTNMSDDMASIE